MVEENLNLQQQLASTNIIDPIPETAAIISGSFNKINDLDLFKRLFCDKFFYVFITYPKINYTNPPKTIVNDSGINILDYGACLGLSNFDYFLKGSLSCYKMERTINHLLQLLQEREATEVSINGLDIILRLFIYLSNYALPTLIITNKSDISV